MAAVLLALPGIVTRRVAAEAERRGFRAAVGDVAIGALAVSLREVSLRSRTPGVSVEIERADIELGALGALQSVAASGVTVDVDLGEAGLRGLGGRRGTEPGPGAPSPRGVAAGVPVVVTGKRVTLRRGVDELVVVDGFDARSDGAGAAIDLRRARLGRAGAVSGELLGLSAELRRERGALLLRRLRVGRARLSLEEHGSADDGAPSAGAAAAPAGARPPGAAAFLELLAPGGVIEIADLALGAERHGRHEPLLLDASARLDAPRAGELKLAAQGAAAGGGRFDASLRVWPRELRADGKITLQALPLTLLASTLPMVPWESPASGRIDGELQVMTESIERVGLVGHVELSNVGLVSARLAPAPVRGLSLSLAGTGAWLPRQRKLEIADGRVRIGTASVSLKGSIALATDHYALELDAELARGPCTQVVRAIPKELLGDIALTEWAGTLGGRVVLRADSRALDDLVLDLDVQDRCEFVRVPELADLRRFTQPFVHAVEEPDGTLFQMETGPGTAAWTPLPAISPYFVHAVLAHEDPQFFTHRGFSPAHIRAALARDLAAGRYVVGASTITMQLVKNVFLRREKTLARKIQEVFLTWWVERMLAKQDILELYLNVIEYGPGIYGVRNAARHYWNRLPAELSPAEAVFLATILPNPKRYHAFFERGQLTPTWQQIMRRLIERLRDRGSYSAEAAAYGLREVAGFRFSPEGTAAPPREIPGAAAPLPIAPQEEEPFEPPPDGFD